MESYDIAVRNRHGRRASKVVRRPYSFQIVVEQDKARYFVAECPALKACYTQGRTYEEAIANIMDVIGLCLAHSRARRRRIPSREATAEGRASAVASRLIALSAVTRP